MLCLNLGGNEWLWVQMSCGEPELLDDSLNFGGAGPDPFDNVIGRAGVGLSPTNCLLGGIFKDPNPPLPKKTGKTKFEK